MLKPGPFATVPGRTLAGIRSKIYQNSNLDFSLLIYVPYSFGVFSSELTCNHSLILNLSLSLNQEMATKWPYTWFPGRLSEVSTSSAVNIEVSGTSNEGREAPLVVAVLKMIFNCCSWPPPPPGVPGEGPDCHFPREVVGFGPIPARIRYFLIWP